MDEKRDEGLGKKGDEGKARGGLCMMLPSAKVPLRVIYAVGELK
jgi:hypothetical protein